MYELVCSDIRITDIKLKRIKLCKKQLQRNKPSLSNTKRLKIWKQELNKLNKQEETINNELQQFYTDLEKFL